MTGASDRGGGGRGKGWGFGKGEKGGGGVGEKRGDWDSEVEGIGSRQLNRSRERWCGYTCVYIRSRFGSVLAANMRRNGIGYRTVKWKN